MGRITVLSVLTSREQRLIFYIQVETFAYNFLAFIEKCWHDNLLAVTSEVTRVIIYHGEPPHYFPLVIYPDGGKPEEFE